MLVANVSRGPNLLEIVPPATGFANSPPAYLYSETVAEPNGFFFHLRFELCQRYAFCSYVSPSMDSTAALAFAWLTPLPSVSAALSAI